MIRIHPTAEVSDQATIGEGTRVWHHAQVREGAKIGRDCILGKGAYVDRGVEMSDCCKVQNYASIYQGTTLGYGVFVGPGAVLANDRLPRAITPDGALKGDTDWEVSPVLVKEGASIGAGSIILPGIILGEFALVGAGAVVTHDVPAHGLVVGNPARLIGYVCRCGRRLALADAEAQIGRYRCSVCIVLYSLPLLPAGGEL